MVEMEAHAAHAESLGVKNRTGVGWGRGAFIQETLAV